MYIFVLQNNIIFVELRIKYMNKKRNVNNLLVIKYIICAFLVICVFSCAKTSMSELLLSQDDLKEEIYYDSIKNIELKLLLPKNMMLEDRKELLSVIYGGDTIAENDMLIGKLFKYKNDCKSELIALCDNEQYVTMNVIDLSWIEGGDTLKTTSNLTYLKRLGKLLSVNDIVSNAEELDSLAKMLKDKHEAELLSPEVDVTLLGDSVFFHYNKIKHKEFSISFPIDEFINRFQKLKTIYYNE